MMDLLRGLKNIYFLGIAAANLEPPLALTNHGAGFGCSHALAVLAIQ